MSPIGHTNRVPSPSIRHVAFVGGTTTALDMSRLDTSMATVTPLASTSDLLATVSEPSLTSAPTETVTPLALTARSASPAARAGVAVAARAPAASRPAAPTRARVRKVMEGAPGTTDEDTSAHDSDRWPCRASPPGRQDPPVWSIEEPGCPIHRYLIETSWAARPPNGFPD